MIVAGNWKMNTGLEDAVALAADVVEATQADADAVRVVVCPPAVWLDAVRERVAQSAVALGAQTMNANASGAFTGEISAAMLIDLEVAYVILGHSERRAMGERDGDVAEKARAAQAAGLTPIVCVGETLEQRDAGDAESTVLGQIEASLEGAAAGYVVAYEPVWAIGTGRTATPEQAQAMHAAIRGRLEDDATPILYGGSVKPDNAAELFAQPDIDGALVGGASLEAGSFAAIVAAAREAS